VGFGLWFFGGYSWGWHHWRPDWHRRAIVYNHSPYIARSHTLIERNTFYHENFAHAQGMYNAGGLYGSPNSHVLLTPQRGFAELHGEFGASGRGELGGGREGAGEMRHGGGFHGGGDHR
jgi:hypothetical protein